ncbi:hypothetical protein LTR85_008121 [Meristemomyces frigidus]|nr:hypothetical protein LTR85_008121 [Meristemomyces frigidus]
MAPLDVTETCRPKGIPAEGLTISLRSWRGSVYSDTPLSGVRGQLSNLEKATEADEDEVVLHPKLSRQTLAEQRAQRQDDQRHALRKASRSFPHDRHHHDAPPSTTTHHLAGRRATLQPQTPSSAKKSILTTTAVEGPDPADDTNARDVDEPLSTDDFYELIGINKPASRHDNAKDLALQHGLYRRIQHQLSHTQIKYRVFDILTYACLALQLLLSAIFIVLGSLAKIDSHIAIAVLGAFSTITAARDALRKVVFEAEDLYWDVEAGRQAYYQDIVKLREDFLRVMEDSGRNHPDTWNATAPSIAQGVRMSGRNKQQAVLVKGMLPAV